MASFIQSLDQLEKLQSINGLPISQIERRSEVIEDNTSDPEEWKYRSFDGFLGQEEHIKDVIKKDWKTVAELGYTHKEFAQHLRSILTLVEQKRKASNLGVMTPIQVEYGFQNYPKQSYHVTHQLFSGYQFSLFYNPKETDSSFNTKWNEEYCIQNVNTKLQIKVAGNAHVGIIEYKLGFYEGGDVNNAYRVDPVILLSILTGRCTPQVIEIAQRKENKKLQEPTNELKYPSVTILLFTTP